VAGADIAVASTQHPDARHGLAELVGSLTERQHLAPSLALVGVTGRYALDGPTVGHTIHSLLQSDQTIMFSTQGLGGGGQILDTTGSAVVISVADVEVDVMPDPVDAGSPPPVDTVTGQLGSLQLTTAKNRSDTAAFSIAAPNMVGSMWHFDGELRRRCQHIDALLHSVDPILTTSAGATPIGLPSPVTSTDGNRILSIDGLPARSLILNRLELDGPETEGPSIDLPRMVVELVQAAGSKRHIAVTESGSVDGSITLAESVGQGTVVQLLRHDPALAADEVVNRQLHQRRGDSKAVVATSDLSPPAAGNLVLSAASALSPEVMAVLEPQRRGPGLPWPTASVLTFG
jgi:hypothetical protein